MNLYDLLPIFKVVEINNSVSIRTGHIIAQAELLKSDYLGVKADGTTPADYVENGYILYLDLNGKLKSPGNVDAIIKASQPAILHFTEELFTTGLSEELQHFAVEFNDENIAYPRGLVLHVGDAFTTNNFVGTYAGATLATVNAKGQIALHANKAGLPASYTGPLFNVVATKLPDGDTDAVELTVLAEIIVTAA
jgi:hypothetical protein